MNASLDLVMDGPLVRLDVRLGGRLVITLVAGEYLLLGRPLLRFLLFMLRLHVRRELCPVLRYEITDVALDHFQITAHRGLWLTLHYQRLLPLELRW